MDTQPDMIELDTLAERVGEIARRVELGETVVVTRNGKPVADIVPHKLQGLDRANRRRRLDAFKRQHGIEKIVEYIAPDFDDPMPEDVLLQPLPEQPE